MRQMLRSCLLLLFIVLLPAVVQANSLGIAGEYNVFVFDDIEQYGTDVEGRVAAGGDVSYSDFSIASKVQNKNGLPDLVVGGNLRLYDGSVGYLTPGNTGGPNSQKGTIQVGGTATFVRNPDNSPSVGYDPLTFKDNLGKNNLQINFEAEQKYLTTMSGAWSGMATTGRIDTPWGGQLYLSGANPKLNIFNLNSSLLRQNLGFFLNVPQESTVLLNIKDADADKKLSLKQIGFYISKTFMANDYFAHDDAEALAKYLSGKSAGYPHSNILFNFWDAEEILIDLIEINGSLLAPYAKILFEKNAHIDGNLIAYSLFGQGESHMELFKGQLPVSEPATLIMLGSALIGIAALQRRKNS